MKVLLFIRDSKFDPWECTNDERTVLAETQTAFKTRTVWPFYEWVLKCGRYVYCEIVKDVPNA